VPFAWQLDGQGYVLDLRNQARPARPAAPADQPDQTHPTPLPSVLLVSRLADRELDVVAQLLARVGIPVTRLHAETAAQADLIVDSERQLVRVAGRSIRPTVTWIRHFAVTAMPAQHSALRRRFAAQSWQATADQLGTASAVTIGARGPGLLDQLAAARAAGIPVPRTVVAADPAAAAREFSGPRVVLKALHEHFAEVRPGRLSGIFAEVADREALTAADFAGCPPVVLQEYIEHTAEVRAYYADGEITAFTISKSDPAQLWTDPARVSIAQISPPPAVAAAIRLLAAALSLRYGAFDFLISAGAAVFLEVNLAGDWRWIETRLGQDPVSVSVAAMLRAEHDRAAATVPADRRPPVDLLRFLSGG
jgi:hypothetical protein